MYAVGAYGSGSYAANLASAVPGFSTAQPYVEQDKSSRIGAIFEGVSGLLQTWGDVKARLKYAPQPIPTNDNQAPFLTGYYSNGEPMLGYAQANSGLFGGQNKPLLIAGAAILGLFLLMKK